MAGSEKAARIARAPWEARVERKRDRELYEAAAALLDAALDALTDVQLPASVAERFRAAERKTRAALARARGETP